MEATTESAPFRRTAAALGRAGLDYDSIQVRRDIDPAYPYGIGVELKDGRRHAVVAAGRSARHVEEAVSALMAWFAAHPA